MSLTIIVSTIFMCFVMLGGFGSLGEDYSLASRIAMTVIGIPGSLIAGKICNLLKPDMIFASDSTTLIKERLFWAFGAPFFACALGFAVASSIVAKIIEYFAG